jgi:hypothetical protein
MIKLKDLLTEEQDSKVALLVIQRAKENVRTARAAIDKSLRKLPNSFKHAQKHGYESELMEFVDALQAASNILRKVE